MGETGSEDERRGRGSGRRSLFGVVFLLGRYWAAGGRQTEGRSSRRAISDGLEADHGLKATYGLPYYSIDRYTDEVLDCSGRALSWEERKERLLSHVVLM